MKNLINAGLMTNSENSGSRLTHSQYMELALIEAEKAFKADEVPVGAVLVDGQGNILAANYNQPIYLHDPTAHAEILVLRNAGQKIQNYRFLNTTLYVTVEPCMMCMGAIIHARVNHIVFGAKDPKWGAAGSLYEFSADHRLNHRPQITRGVCEEECQKLMKDFFNQKRNKK